MRGHTGERLGRWEASTYNAKEGVRLSTSLYATFQGEIMSRKIAAALAVVTALSLSGCKSDDSKSDSPLRETTPIDPRSSTRPSRRTRTSRFHPPTRRSMVRSSLRSKSRAIRTTSTSTARSRPNTMPIQVTPPPLSRARSKYPAKVSPMTKWTSRGMPTRPEASMISTGR